MGTSTTYTLATAPAAEPVTLTEVKNHLRIDTTDEDGYLGALVTAARLHTEQVTNRALVSQTWDWWFNGFPALSIVVPKAPLISVTYIKSTDTSGTLKTWDSANYTVDTDSYEGRIYPNYNGEWPSDVRNHPKSVNIRFIAGYADSGASPQILADNVPQALKHAILFLIGHLYENREMTSQNMTITNVPMSYRALVDPYRVFNH